MSEHAPGLTAGSLRRRPATHRLHRPLPTLPLGQQQVTEDRHGECVLGVVTQRSTHRLVGPLRSLENRRPRFPLPKKRLQPAVSHLHIQRPWRGDNRSTPSIQQQLRKPNGRIVQRLFVESSPTAHEQDHNLAPRKRRGQCGQGFEQAGFKNSYVSSCKDSALPATTRHHCVGTGSKRAHRPAHDRTV